MTEKTQIDTLVEKARKVATLNMELRDAMREKIRCMNSIVVGMDNMIREQNKLANELEGLFVEL